MVLQYNIMKHRCRLFLTANTMTSIIFSVGAKIVEILQWAGLDRNERKTQQRCVFFPEWRAGSSNLH